MTLPIHTILNNQYRTERVIGSGGFGITYYARHIHTGKEYAIKELFIAGKCERTGNGRTVTFEQQDAAIYIRCKDRFIEEAMTLQKLNHPHVVHVMYAFDENNTAYIVMDFVKGQTLQHIIDHNGPMSYHLAVNYMAQLAEAVQHCHDNHILHRDIKPENVMITPDNKVVLIDFGSARSFVHDEVQTHTAILTQGYAPLEQYTSTSQKGNYSDIYSLGAVFYFILTGLKPMSATDRVMTQMTEPKTYVNAIPNSANSTIMKAMQMEPKNRYQSVKAFMEAMLGGTTEVVQGAPIMNPPVVSPTPAPRPRKKKQKNGWIVWVVIGVILFYILIIYVFFSL